MRKRKKILAAGIGLAIVGTITVTAVVLKRHSDEPDLIAIEKVRAALDAAPRSDFTPIKCSFDTAGAICFTSHSPPGIAREKMVSITKARKTSGLCLPKKKPAICNGTISFQGVDMLYSITTKKVVPTVAASATVGAEGFLSPMKS